MMAFHGSPRYTEDNHIIGLSVNQAENSNRVMCTTGVEGVVCGLEGTDLADRCILTKLE
jgi:hypothetical protein